MPRFIPISSAIGPDTRIIGACGPVDIAHVRKPIDGSSTHSIMAMITGITSGRHPAITALAAILRTVPTPKPGANRPTTSSPSRPEAAIIASTLACVGGTSGRPSLQPLRDERALHRVERVHQIVAREDQLGRRSSTHRLEVRAARRTTLRSRSGRRSTARIASSTISVDLLAASCWRSTRARSPGRPRARRTSSTLKCASSSKIAAV